MAVEKSPNNERVADTGEPTVDQAQPYRSPANVSEASATAGVKGSPIVWIAVLTCAGLGAIGAGIFLMSPVRDFNMNRRPVEDYVEDFGGSRIPPPEIEEQFLPQSGPSGESASAGVETQDSGPVIP